MATKIVCDDCGKNIRRISQRVDIRYYGENRLPNFEMCYDCFTKHWKPTDKKFAIKKYVD